MSHRIAIKLLLAIYLNGIFSQITIAQNSAEELTANKTINQLYHRVDKQPATQFSNRIDYISQQFLNKPYLLTALGDGEQDRFDQFPLYRTDAFDCETYVDTVLAIALGKNTQQFKQCINQIRYHEGKIAYINRNHFTCLDWNLNNQHQGFIKDITTSFHDRNNRSVVTYAKAVINKAEWYQRKPLSTIRLKHATLNEQKKRLEELKKLGAALPTTTATIAYIPLTALFDKNGKANHYLFNQIPSGAIVEIVRPNWDLTKIIGTHLNVSHLGFSIWKGNVLYFREASSQEHGVVDVLLIDYLRKAKSSPTIKGINVQIAVSHAQCG